MKDIYIRIKELREERGMTQSELAEKVGYTSRAMISQIESGKINLPIEKVQAIAKALDANPRKLFGTEDADGTGILIEFIEHELKQLNEPAIRKVKDYVKLLLLDENNLKQTKEVEEDG